MAYTKTTWQDLPSTATPINATNLNKMEQGIYDANDKNIITAGLSSGFTVSTAGNNDLTLNKTIAQVGSKLSLSSGKVVIGSGVTKVLISGMVMMNTSTSGPKNFIITYNNNESALSMNTITATSNINLSRELSSKLIEVSEGDVIGLRIYGAVGDYISDAVARTYITVKQVD